MPRQDPHDFVAFRHVRVIQATAPALFCAIAAKRVWLPREHVKGRLWSRGDRGTLCVRRWVALDRHLIARRADGVVLTIAPERPPGVLHLLRHGPEVPVGH